MEKSKFAEWFAAQHGKRTADMPDHTDQQLRELARLGRDAERALALRELWDEKRTSALYAWQASRPKDET